MLNYREGMVVLYARWAEVLRRCQQEEPLLREVESRHGAACHQLPQYDGAPLMMPRLEHKREVTPETAAGVLP